MDMLQRHSPRVGDINGRKQSKGERCCNKRWAVMRESMKQFPGTQDRRQQAGCLLGLAKPLSPDFPGM